MSGIDYSNRLAAVVYDNGADAAALLVQFVAELKREGVDVCGVVEPPRDGTCGPAAPMLLLDVRMGDTLRISQPLGSGALSCRLDTRAMADVAMRLRRAAEGPSDLMIVSKFGKQEAEGRGFLPELALAVSEGRCVLTTVKRDLLKQWHQFSDGMGTVLECRSSAVRAWWHSARQPEPVRHHPRLAEASW